MAEPDWDGVGQEIHSPNYDADPNQIAVALATTQIAVARAIAAVAFGFSQGFPVLQIPAE